jgi:hypothetical protein
MDATRSIASILVDIIQEIIANWQKIDPKIQLIFDVFGFRV